VTRWFLIAAFLFAVIAVGLTFGRPKQEVVEPAATSARAQTPRDRPTTGLTTVEQAANQGDYTASKGTGVVLPSSGPDEDEQARCKAVVEHLAELGVRADKAARERLSDPALRELMDGQCQVSAMKSEIADCILASKDLEAVESCHEVLEPEKNASLDDVYERAEALGVKMPEREPDDDDDDEEEEKGARGPAPPD